VQVDGVETGDELRGPDGEESLAAQDAEALEHPVRRPIPRVKPLTTAELDVSPPPKERYPVGLGRALRELVRARELVLTFVERDLRLRYRQAVLGAAWAILQPLLLMVIFSLVFGRIAHVGSEGVPYPLFSYTALLPWGYFSGSINYGTTSIVTNSAIVRKIYLPREVFPLSSVISAFVDFAVSALILLGMLLAYGYPPTLTWVAYPVLFGVLTMFALAVTLAASLVTVYFRDTRYGIPTLLQVVLYATPIAYPLAKASRALPAGIRGAYPYLDPLVPLMDGFRRVLLHDRWPEWGPVGVSAAVSAALLVLTYAWYKRVDPRFADVI
jgi:ABC-type polysaccharide/polyol phosphate export permease